ncbi:ComF family protein [Erythrobacter sp. SDW2]|uniref:ComF family protein n=1 Tax=Erythrobacter sp. SDW2 TaxID=2907154 RepID=UPI00351D85B9
MAEPPKHVGISAATLYNDTSRQLVLRFKHGGRIALATMMARLMIARLGELPHDSILVPVPLHRWRIWRRGYNQAALLAREIGRLTGRAVCLDALHRVKQTPSLGGLGRKARERALSGAIIARAGPRKALEGLPVILVDDVLTSGATTDACTRALLRGGAKSVRIACFARVLDETVPPQTAMPESERPRPLGPRAPRDEIRRTRRPSPEGRTRVHSLIVLSRKQHHPHDAVVPGLPPEPGHLVGLIPVDGWSCRGAMFFIHLADRKEALPCPSCFGTALC